MTTIAEIKAKFDDARATMKAEGEAALKGAFTEMFDKFPIVKSVVWTQYTPYFNDGDTCEFSVHKPKLRSKADEDATYSYGEDDLLGYGEREKHPELQAFWSENMDPVFALEELMERVFGDHVQVVATRDGFAVEEYSHD